MTLAVRTPEEMRELGARVAGLLGPGDLVVAVGPLGAGKTVFAQGVARGLGVPGRITSPTFVIARVHRDGRVPFVHVDAYRLSSLAEIDDLDLDADLPASVTYVEWGEGLVEHLAEARLVVTLARRDDDESRSVEVASHGASWAARAPGLARITGG